MSVSLTSKVPVIWVRSPTPEVTFAVARDSPASPSSFQT
jgi:hypothetical protein